MKRRSGGPKRPSAAPRAAETRGEDGKIHPAAIFDAIKAVADPDYIAVADGGDLLSFFTNVYLEVFLVSGFLSKSVAAEMSESLAEMRKEL